MHINTIFYQKKKLVCVLFEIAKGSWLKFDWQDLPRTAMAENKVEQTSNRWIEGTFKLREEGLKIVCFFLLFFSGFFPAFSFKITLIILYQLNSRNRII